MSTLKVIAGLGSIVAALVLGPFFWVCFVYGDLWFKFLPVGFDLGLAAIGFFLILKRRLPLAKRAKMLITIFISAIIISPIILDIYIRGERHALQIQAKEFLSRPVPDMFQTDTIDGYQARPDETVLSTSRRLIKRYADNGRIRWSAALQGQFAVQPFETASCEEAGKTNEAARIYIVDCKAIVDKEWRMGFWQWVEDTIEMKRTIPEIEEEDRVDRLIQQIDGTWTNSSGTMTISPNGTFSASWSSQTHTNIFKGTQVFRARDAVFMVYPDGTAGTPSTGEKDFRIIHVDKHNLVYEVDDQTNSMSR
jgi:hypothetical protein